ncbi:MAG: CBS domain-containing protein [Candidatus Micrarchaeota archaeon]|nr:CBS domain-containing protein [Candidatus Micrarchaeota archaeon]
MEMERLTVLDASEPVSKAINAISSSKLPVIITKGGKYLGLIDERAIARKAANPKKEKCEKIAERTPVLSPKSTVLDACKAFFAGRFKAIPVVDGGKILGAVTRHTLLLELLNEKMLSRKRVEEAMSSPVVAIDASATVGQARAELRKHNIRRLVVIQDGKVAGMVSVFDLTRFALKEKVSPTFYYSGEKSPMDSQPISSYMNKKVETIAPTDSLAAAASKMLEQKVAALVVSQEGRPVGILTARDIFQLAISYEKAQQVFVSGLPYENKEYQEEIVKEGEKLLSKLGKSFAISSLAFHVKHDGSGFSIRARLQGSKSFSASASDFRIENALHKVIYELRRMAERSKLEKIERKKREARMKEE